MTGRLLVTGSRAWTDRAEVVRGLSDACAVLKAKAPITLVHGAARGADLLCAAVWFEWHQVWPYLCGECEAHPADWERHGKQAGFIRNAEMVNSGADLCVAFAASFSSGTGHCARLARKAGIRVMDRGANTGRSGVAA